METLKCETCKFMLFHSGGSFQDVAEGGDDPYSYYYCLEGHWSSMADIEEIVELEEVEEFIRKDPFKNCKDYKLLEK